MSGIKIVWPRPIQKSRKGKRNSVFGGKPFPWAVTPVFLLAFKYPGSSQMHIFSPSLPHRPLESQPTVTKVLPRSCFHYWKKISAFFKAQWVKKILVLRFWNFPHYLKVEQPNLTNLSFQGEVTKWQFEIQSLDRSRASSSVVVMANAQIFIRLAQCVNLSSLCILNENVSSFPTALILQRKAFACSDLAEPSFSMCITYIISHTNSFTRMYYILCSSSLCHKDYISPKMKWLR